MVFHKKAQAAMEFLMHYGWAILVILVAIGGLAHFGVMRNDLFLTDYCRGVQDIVCLDNSVSSSSVSLALQSNARDTINITYLSAQGCSGYASGVMFHGDRKIFTIPDCPIEEGSYSGIIYFRYRTGSGISHERIGRILNNGRDNFNTDDFDNSATQSHYSENKDIPLVEDVPIIYAASYYYPAHNFKEELTDKVAEIDFDSAEVSKEGSCLHMVFDSSLDYGDIINVQVKCSEAGLLHLRKENSPEIVSIEHCIMGGVWLSVNFKIASETSSGSIFDIDSHDTNVEYDFVSAVKINYDVDSPDNKEIYANQTVNKLPDAVPTNTTYIIPVYLVSAGVYNYSNNELLRDYSDELYAMDYKLAKVSKGGESVNFEFTDSLVIEDYINMWYKCDQSGPIYLMSQTSTEVINQEYCEIEGVWFFKEFNLKKLESSNKLWRLYAPNSDIEYDSVGAIKTGVSSS